MATIMLCASSVSVNLTPRMQKVKSFGASVTNRSRNLSSSRAPETLSVGTARSRRGQNSPKESAGSLLPVKAEENKGDVTDNGQAYVKQISEQQSPAGLNVRQSEPFQKRGRRTQATAGNNSTSKKSSQREDVMEMSQQASWTPLQAGSQEGQAAPDTARGHYLGDRIPGVGVPPPRYKHLTSVLSRGTLADGSRIYWAEAKAGSKSGRSSRRRRSKGINVGTPRAAECGLQDFPGVSSPPPPRLKSGNHSKLKRVGDLQHPAGTASSQPARAMPRTGNGAVGDDSSDASVSTRDELWPSVLPCEPQDMAEEASHMIAQSTQQSWKVGGVRRTMSTSSSHQGPTCTPTATGDACPGQGADSREDREDTLVPKHHAVQQHSKPGDCEVTFPTVTSRSLATITTQGTSLRSSREVKHCTETQEGQQKPFADRVEEVLQRWMAVTDKDARDAEVCGAVQDAEAFLRFLPVSGAEQGRRDLKVRGKEFKSSEGLPTYLTPPYDATMLLVKRDAAQLYFRQQYRCLVLHQARLHNRHPSLTIDELFEAGQRGLWEAAIRFDPSNTGKFHTYAFYHVRQQMQSCYREVVLGPDVTRHSLAMHMQLKKVSEQLQSAHGHIPAVEEVARVGGVSVKVAKSVLNRPLSLQSLDEAWEDDDSQKGRVFLESLEDEDNEINTGALLAADADKYATSALLQVQFQALLKDLIPEDARVVELHYGLEGGGEGLPLSGVAKVLGVSRQAVSKRHQRAMTRLREKLSTANQEELMVTV